jgi:hypothetical protein
MGELAMLRPDDLMDELRKKPFEPFRIHVSDGSVYEIRHPEFVMVSRSKVPIFVPAPNRPHPFFERYDTVALLHITRLEPIEPAGTTATS